MISHRPFLVQRILQSRVGYDDEDLQQDEYAP